MPKQRTFHVVRRSVHGKFRTYEIYADNEPYLVPGKGMTLGKHEAYGICHLLNDGPWEH